MDKEKINEKKSKEKDVVGLMIGLYCKKNHKQKKAMKSNEYLCSDCRNLLSYVNERVQKCPFTATKTFCSMCKAHCYKPEMREKIRIVMRFSGPRMLFYHPVLAIRHLRLTIKSKRADKKSQEKKA